jgi:membrane-bound metal-dependent hydrolase YbcI (DUF457 family)
MPHVDINLVWCAFLVGFISHLVMDTFTKEGVPWLLPLTIKIGLPPVKRLRITTGKTAEMFFVFPMLLVVDIWLCADHYNQIAAFIQQHLVR